MEWTLDFNSFIPSNVGGEAARPYTLSYTHMWLCVAEAVILNWSSDKEKWDIFLKHSWSLWEQPEFRKSCTPERHLKGPREDAASAEQVPLDRDPVIKMPLR